MSAGEVLATIMGVWAGALLALVAGLGAVTRATGRPPTMHEAAMIISMVTAVMVVVTAVLWPDMPAAPLMVEPAGPEPARDLLSGEPL